MELLIILALYVGATAGVLGICYGVIEGWFRYQGWKERRGIQANMRRLRGRASIRYYP